jgi:hypothetical protein
MDGNLERVAIFKTKKKESRFDCNSTRAVHRGIQNDGNYCQ